MQIKINYLSILISIVLTFTNPITESAMAQNLETATLGGGCFWCTEAIFQRLNGVTSVVSGYSGGKLDNPTYDSVSSGMSDHAEVVQIQFDPKIISFKDILEVFFHLHDPTTLNRQGADQGTQYRSIVLFHSEDQKYASQEVINKITNEHLWNAPIVTELKPFEKFYGAEEYHQNYYQLNKSKPYCSLVIGPKIAKLNEKFKDKLKPQ